MENNEYNHITEKTIKPVTENKPFVKEMKIIIMCDNSPDLSHLTQGYNDVKNDDERQKYLNQDAERLKNYGDTWECIGIKCIAVVYIPIGQNNYKIQEIDSGGLWGLETDSDKEYLTTVKNEQIDELKGYLKLFNIDIPNNLTITEENE